MIFSDQDPEMIQARARSVFQLLPGASKAELTGSETKVKINTAEGATVFDAVRGRVIWTDADGEVREFQLPAGVTAEAVAALVFGLAEVVYWS